MDKRFKFSASQIRPLVEGRGSCLASDLITVEGILVGYMYREITQNNLDSGWRFFAGIESQDYVENPNNFSLYDVNTIANYDPSILAFLDEPPGTAWGRDALGGFKRELFPVGASV
jgi:hypothetical protein